MKNQNNTIRKPVFQKILIGTLILMNPWTTLAGGPDEEDCQNPQNPPIPNLTEKLNSTFEMTKGMSPERFKELSAAERGLHYLASKVTESGRVEGGNYPVAGSALAGMAFLSEGSTLGRGRYSRQIQRIVEYILAQSEAGDGFIGGADRGMYGHGYALSFLAQVYGEVSDPVLRNDIQKAIRRGVQLLKDAQTNAGGWGYLPGDGSDEGTLTAGSLHALRMAHDVGFVVEPEVIKKAQKYLEDTTLPNGGVAYSSSSRTEPRFPITAAKIVSMAAIGDYTSDHMVRSVQYFQNNLATTEAGDYFGYNNYNISQAAFILGGDTWKKYKEVLMPKLLAAQGEDGGWTTTYPVVDTAMAVLTLSLEKRLLPMFQR